MKRQATIFRQAKAITKHIRTRSIVMQDHVNFKSSALGSLLNVISARHIRNAPVSTTTYTSYMGKCKLCNFVKLNQLKVQIMRETAQGLTMLDH